MAVALTKANIKAIPYGKEVGFGRGIMGRKLKDGESARMFLQKKLYGKPIKVKLGTWPDMDIDQIEEKAREYRRLIEQGIHPYAEEEDKRKKRDEDLAEKARRGLTLRDIITRREKYKLALGMRGSHKSTLDDIRSTCSRFFGHYMDQPVANIRSEDVRKWMTSENEAGRQRVARRSLDRLKTLLDYAVNTEEVLDRNPLNFLKGLDRPKRDKPKLALFADECVDLLEMIGRLTDPSQSHHVADDVLRAQKRQETNKGSASVPYISPGEVSARRHVAYHAIALLLLTGIRLQEMLKLEWKDVVIEKRKWQRLGAQGPYFVCKQFKLNGQTSGIPITDYMMPTFEALQKLKVDQFVFPSPMSGSVGIKPIQLLRLQFETLQKLLPHIENKLGALLLRHTFASTAQRLRYSMDEIDRATGHMARLNNRPGSTEEYIAINADDNRKMFQEINIAMLDNQSYYSAEYEALELRSENIEEYHS